MTKQDLVAKIASDADISKKAAEDALKSFIDGVKESLSKGEGISLVGFGTFGVSDRAAREGRNPKTGEKIQIAARKVPTFKAGKGLKEAVN
jgi:DNA-binding protein HU-beta